jgi:hypothetical protein
MHYINDNTLTTTVINDVKICDACAHVSWALCTCKWQMVRMTMMTLMLVVVIVAVCDSDVDGSDVVVVP